MTLSTAVSTGTNSATAQNMTADMSTTNMTGMYNTSDTSMDGSGEISGFKPPRRAVGP